MNQTRFLVTGASGFLGTALIDKMMPEFSVTGLSRKGGSNLKIDLSTDQFTLPDFDFVIHTAGLAHLPFADADSMYKNNVLATTNLLCQLNPAILKGFVFCSTVAVYGKQTGHQIDESSTPQPVDSYGSSKLQAEQLIVTWCESHRIPYLILRLPLVFGANAPGNMNRLLDSLSKGRFFVIKGNNSKRSMVLLGDLVEFINEVALKGIKISGAYNLTDGIDVGFNDFVAALCSSKKFNKPIEISSWFAKLLALIGSLFGGSVFSMAILDKMTQTLTFSSKKATDHLGWRPRSVLNYFVEN